MRVHLVSSGVAIACLPTALSAAAPEAEFGIETELVVSGLDKPAAVVAPAGDPRLFVIEQHAGIRVVENGVLLPTPFLDLSAEVATGFEQGVLGLAFHPNYDLNGAFFVYTTDLAGDTLLASYLVDPLDPDVADASSKQVVLTQTQLDDEHNAGTIVFGPRDGYLYVAVGDGATWLTNCNAQNPGTFLGKILRIDVNQASGYSVPPTNPFIGVPGYLPEIWSLGVRNPWRIGFDSGTDELYIADVGTGHFEEVNVEPSLAGGRNYGWKMIEGTQCNNTDGCLGPVPACDDPGLTGPLHQYSHAEGCAIVGGAVYRGCEIPQLHGRYVYADFCTRRVWSLLQEGGVLVDVAEHTEELTPEPPIFLQLLTSVSEDGFGDLYITDQVGGEIFKIVPSEPLAPEDDCDGNGLDDGCEIGLDAVLDLSGDGVLDRCESLSGNAAEISVGGGGSLSMALHPGAEHASSTYLVAGSFAGTAPGIPLGPWLLPLNLDVYLLHSVAHPNEAPLAQSLGALDGAGEAEASFTLAPGVLGPALVGSTVSHAYVLLDGALAVSFVSNAIGSTLAP